MEVKELDRLIQQLNEVHKNLDEKVLFVDFESNKMLLEDTVKKSSDLFLNEEYNEKELMDKIEEEHKFLK